MVADIPLVAPAQHFHQTQGTIRSTQPDWTPWLEFFLNAREKLMIGAMPELAAKLYDLTREHGRLTTADAVKLTGANRNTLKQHFRGLVHGGHLQLHGQARGAWYSIR